MPAKSEGIVELRAHGVLLNSLKQECVGFEMIEIDMQENLKYRIANYSFQFYRKRIEPRAVKRMVPVTLD